MQRKGYYLNHNPRSSALLALSKRHLAVVPILRRESRTQAHVPGSQARSTEAASTGRMWMKSAIVEREAGDLPAERVLLQDGIQRFPSFWKLHLMLGQLEERAGNLGAFRM